MSWIYGEVSVRRMPKEQSIKNMSTKTMRIGVTITLCLGLAAGLLAGCASERENGEKSDNQAKLQAQAKITKDQAEAIAMAKVPNGTIKESELERENGHLQWSFDMATPGEKDITEVNIDAITGDVLNIGKEAPDAD
jgi:uncharacterized membrane protein YkoI